MDLEFDELLSSGNFEWLLKFLNGMIKPLAATAVVLMAVILSYMQKLGLEGEMVYSIIRAFLQLSVIGFVLQFIFSQNHAVWIIVAYIFMVSVAGYTAGQRAKHVPRGKWVAGASILAGTAVTMFLLVILNVFPFTPRYIIPVAGMMVGNAMTVTGVTMKRLRDDIKGPNEPGRDSIGTRSNTASSHASTSEKGSCYCAFSCTRQCQNCGSHFTSWSNDRAYHGRGFSTRSYSIADCGDEHAHWCINC
ncbi:hypothetical protein OIU84_026166 [Salix udensis]|uniref:Uncharacterized protein n=1 Tax=Salix udensis TaxID=889485 RepID=A0AAD6KL50_9ROSI|nr:hypothetical protein OIU84_026166 [Salix udensis]